MSVGTLDKATLEDSISHECKKVQESSEAKKKQAPLLYLQIWLINSCDDIAPCVPATAMPGLPQLTYLKHNLACALLLSGDPKRALI